MTMTMEETTTLPLTEQRTKARLSLIDAPPVTGTVFEIPPGYRVIEDTPLPSHGPGQRFLVTGITDDGMGPYTLTAAAILGCALPDIHISTLGDQWFSPSRPAGTFYLPSCYVKGARVRQGVVDAPHDTDALVCFADGTVSQWYSNSEQRPVDGMGFRRSLIVVAGPPSALTADDVIDFDGRDWVPVERVRDEAETNLQPAPPVVCPWPTECSAESPLLGLAASAAPVLDPEPEVSAEYVAWSTTWTPGDPSVLFKAFRRGDVLAMGRVAVLAARGGVPEVRSYTGGMGITSVEALRDAYHWVRVASSPAVHPTGDVDPDIRTGLADLNRRKELYSEALNDLADENDWCSEYETVVQPLGFPGRDAQKKSYGVELSVDFSMEDDNVSSHMDRRIEESVFNDNVSRLSLESMKFSGSLRFTMTVHDIGPTGEGALEDRIRNALDERIKNSMVEDALNDLLPGAFDVDDWTIEGFEEDED